MQVGTALSVLAQPGRPDAALYRERMAIDNSARSASLANCHFVIARLPEWLRCIITVQFVLYQSVGG